MSLNKIIHNTETGEISTVEVTEEELLQAQKTFEAQQKAAAEAAAAKAALLEKLGITEEEAKLLLS